MVELQSNHQGDSAVTHSVIQSAIQKLINSEAQGADTDRIVETGLRFWASRTLLSAVELGVFTELARGSQSLEELLPGVEQSVGLTHPMLAGGRSHDRRVLFGSVFFELGQGGRDGAMRWSRLALDPGRLECGLTEGRPSGGKTRIRRVP